MREREVTGGVRQDGDVIVTVLIGPSGAGKSSLLAATAARGPVTVVRTVTTRPRRPGENDLTHEFVSAETFADLQRQGRFLGTHHQYGHDYGLPVLAGIDTTSGPVITCLRAPVVERLRQRHADLDVIAVDAPVSVLLDRLAARGDRDRADPEVLQAERLASRELADLVLDATARLEQLAQQLSERLAER